jgi:hypothetical protein
MSSTPESRPSADLLAFVDQAANSAGDFYDIGSALKNRSAQLSDDQAGWLGTAFDYALTRRIGEQRKASPFGPMLTAGANVYPVPVRDVPAEVAELWRNVIEASSAPAVQARLAHLLFERGGRDGGRHAKTAAEAYLTLGTGSWARIRRVKCLHWALDLARVVNDARLVEATLGALSNIAAEGLATSQEPGVPLHALRVLVDNAPERAELGNLLVQARAAYASEPWNVNEAIDRQIVLA